MATTEENLKTAFAGESQANRKYLAFAKAAEKEGLKNVAKLFLAAAEAETIHALGHFAALDGVKSTLENLKTAVAGETYEYKEMYPAMYEQAERENHKAKRILKYALEAEKVHAELYTKALEAVMAGKDLEAEAYLCPVCGHIELGKPPNKCPICGVPAAKYVHI
ncbi:MAG: rubrerythrin [Bdellovibrionales bacterium RIFOXYD12_FULL_39_22]|nr:MAG: rubrerythrin [Bdellovibrionales bacterium RIFOXYB1_FULL_39_21]OFZ41822.1 MAG: rubrerythrin [Bdellovibrionales bacterium RIFOXYC12_FULL_39_17]OFZ50538.1 MAG: rubrerythrin [Bdellovibrionales bacterium RIFOXYC1_FULL_39_130]OFZ77761.1 MAG: rubrerythrin [Bdellovibrionales bacterium RIFOXYD1_FULL_39_84]OFZ93803.1 MAG: rubrerythrin [Bdellovibrionales bacterium RIFOXYD12_FULL_39_22]HLE11511.1 rubrerythrin family protein [Bacteriovoracaceae bacterium]